MSLLSVIVRRKPPVRKDRRSILGLIKYVVTIILKQNFEWTST